MDPALSILDRALKGDAGALSFLERTAAIYVYDSTTSGPTGTSQPKICGAWDFLNQALSEVERHESRVTELSLDAHAQLLATMSRKAARRCPASDQRLVEVCLRNAAHFHEHGSNDFAHHLIQNNQQMRDRVMGRIATITFDFANHPSSATSCSSAFSNSIAMDSLCAVVAANAISTGPREFTNLVSEWIIPSMSKMPPFAVASIIYHLAAESVSKSAPGGTKDALKNLFDSLISKVLAPMLLEAVRNSDNGESQPGGSDRANSHRIAAMTIKALERWCWATSSSITKLRNVCRTVNINIVEVISDAMYSDSDIVMDALSELLDHLLRKHTESGSAIEGFAIARNVVGLSAFLGPGMDRLQTDVASEVEDRDAILIELVSAIGLQRFRFTSRLSSGDSGVCRCLASIALSIASASQTLMRSGKLNGTEKGMVTLLLTAISHSSLNVYSLALESFKYLINPTNDLSTRLLPLLQSKVITPPSLVGLSSHHSVDIDFHEFERFREYQLAEILSMCYVHCRSYYIDSCCMAIGEFCSAAPNPHTSFQMEAALFCLCTVSVDTSKRALLADASPASIKAAAKACSMQQPGNHNINEKSVAKDAKNHDEKLAKCIVAISKCQAISSFNNPLFLSQLCRLLGRYAKWLSKTSQEGVLDAAAGLALTCFNEAASKFGQNNDLLEEMSAPPFAEAASALRNILSRAPKRFANAEALSALGNGWQSVYSNTCNGASIDDRKALCTGITRVLAVLPAEQWASSLTTLANPTIECIETLLKSINESQTSADKPNLEEGITRMSEEICVLASAIRTFHTVAKKQPNSSSEQAKAPLLCLLHRVWPSVAHIAKTLSTQEVVISSLSEFLLIVISLKDDGKDMDLLKEASEIAITIMDFASERHAQCHIMPIMEFVEEMVETFGHLAEAQISTISPSSIAVKVNQQMHAIVEHLLRKIFHVIQEQSGKENIDALPGLFAVCRACIRRCPSLFFSLTVAPESTEKICSASFNAARSSITSRQFDVIRSALLFLNEAFIFTTVAKAVTGVQDHRTVVAMQCMEAVNLYRAELVTTLVHGSCGIFPREVLDPVGTVLHSILKTTPVDVAEKLCSQALQADSFRLGDEAKRVTLSVLGKGVQNLIQPSLIMDLLDDLWSIHQNDQIGAMVAGGDAIISFTKKYS